MERRGAGCIVDRKFVVGDVWVVAGEGGAGEKMGGGGEVVCVWCV